MDMRLCYEAGAVLFWLLFAYLFMDKFLFRGQLGEICFGKARRRMAKALRGAAGWFDPVKDCLLYTSPSPRDRERGTEERTWTGERENGQERDSGSREKTGERASTCQGGNEAHRKDCGEKQ